MSIGVGLGLIFHGSDEFYHGAYTAIDGEIHRNWTAQLLDNVTGNETASDWIDAAFGIVLSFGLQAPATVGKQILKETLEHGVSSGSRRVPCSQREAG